MGSVFLQNEPRASLWRVGRIDRNRAVARAGCCRTGPAFTKRTFRGIGPTEPLRWVLCFCKTNCSETALTIYKTNRGHPAGGSGRLDRNRAIAGGEVAG